MSARMTILVVALAATAVLFAIPLTAGAFDVTMGGTFTMNFVTTEPPAGDDLMPILGHENSWQVVLHDVEFDCDVETFGPSYLLSVTTLHASSFEFVFMGPDADVLNSVVASQFTQGGLEGDGYFRVEYERDHTNETVMFFFDIWPPVPSEGIYWSVDGYPGLEVFPLEDDCPTIGPFELDATQTILFDHRGPGNNGNLAAINASTLWLQMESPVAEETWGAIKALFR